MIKVKIDSEKCKGCGLCVMYCPKNLLCLSDTINKKGVKPAEMKKSSKDKCSGCASCAIICPDCAIEIIESQKSKVESQKLK